MYLLSKKPLYLHVPVRQSTDKIQFKVPVKILPVYEHSPYHIVTKLWDDFSKEIPNKDNIYDFKKEINRLYKTYKKI